MIRPLRLALLAAALALAAPLSAVAQETGGVKLGSGFKQDPSLPVEITSENLTVDQTAGTANFTGKVLAVQGDMRLTADETLVEYSREAGEITRLTATGSVVLTTPTEAAEAARAVYDLKAGTLVMEGSVLLTQDVGAISGDRLTVTLDSGAARMEGNVRTVFKPAAGSGGKSGQKAAGKDGKASP